MVKQKNFTKIFLSASLFANLALAENQPYIDSIKIQLEKKKSESSSEDFRKDDNYIPYIMKDKEPVLLNEDYIKKIQSEHPVMKSDTSYTEEEKRKLGPASEESAIEAFRQGKSELHPRFQGESSFGFGLRYGVLSRGTISSTRGLQNFFDVYGKKYSPSFSLMFEYQAIQNYLGKWSFFGLMGFQYYHGYGRFAQNLLAPNGTTFSSESRTLFKFYSIPLSLGIKYQFDLAKFIQPYVMVGGSSVIFVEDREDATKGSRGHTEGYLLSGGASFLLDWIYPSGIWNLYAEYGIKHLYLTLDFVNIRTFNGFVRYDIKTFYTGIVFEY